MMTTTTMAMMMMMMTEAKACHTARAPHLSHTVPFAFAPRGNAARCVPCARCCVSSVARFRFGPYSSRPHRRTLNDNGSTACADDGGDDDDGGGETEKTRFLLLLPASDLVHASFPLGSGPSQNLHTLMATVGRTMTT